MDWLASPSDMNAIELVWDCLQRIIAASNVECGTPDSLERELVDVRDMIPLADIRKLSHSFRSHCLEVIQAQDELVPYQADIYGDDVVKRRQLLNFTTPHTMCKIVNFRG